MDNLPGELCVNLVSVGFRVPFGRLSLSPVHNLNTIASFMNKQMNKKQIVLISAVCCLVSACRRVDNSAGSVWIPCGYNTVDTTLYNVLNTVPCWANSVEEDWRTMERVSIFAVWIALDSIRSEFEWHFCHGLVRFPTVSLQQSLWQSPLETLQALRCFLQ